MKWKEFFRPNKYKINISLAILFIGIISGLIKGAITQTGCRSWSCYGLGYKILDIITTIIGLPGAIYYMVFPNLEINFFIWISGIVVMLGYIYLLSSIIIYFVIKTKN